MGKKHKNNQKHFVQPPRVPTAPPVPAPSKEPTADQLGRLDAVEVQTKAMTAEHGVPTLAGVSEPLGPPLEECLKRVEGLLATARGHFEAARELEAAASNETQQRAAQTREQEEALAERKRSVEAALDAMTKKAEEALGGQKKELEDAELDLMQRVEACQRSEAAVKAREVEVLAREASLVVQAASLTDRELNAEQGFLAEKARVLKPLEEEVARLRAVRDQIDAEIRERRGKAEEEARAKSMELAEKWAQQDAARTSREADSRRALDDEMIRERKEKLSNLREELAAERAKAEEDWGKELGARSVVLDERAAELDERADTLAARARELRGAEQDLKAEQEILAEDKAALDRKVERMVIERTEALRHETEGLRQQLGDARALRDDYFAELESRRELDRRFHGRTPKQIVADLKALESERDALVLQVRELPDARAAERLGALERERSTWLEERAMLQGDLARATGELATRRLAAIELEALRKQKEALEIHKQLLDGAVEELHVRVDELTRQEDHRNPMTALADLDESEEFQVEVRTTTPFGRATPTLREFAEDLRHRIAVGVEGRTLYYAERDVRAFLGGLAMTRLMLLQGISGTGKTSLPLAFTSAVGGGLEVVEVQAGWRDRQDLVGYYNAFHRHYYVTNFLRALYKAGTPAYRDRVFMMVLDEINLSRPEQFFADFLSALEQPAADRRLTLVSDPVANAPQLMKEGLYLPIPPNVWFVGTANHDESTSEFADKTYDRAHVMEMPRKTDAAQFDVVTKGARNAISYETLEGAFSAAAHSQEVAVRRATLWLRKAPFATSLGQRFRVGWGNRLEHQLARYLPVVVETGGSIGEAMDHLLATKVLRKLKDRHDVRATALEELRDQILTAWDGLDASDPPERCVALIENEIATKKGEELV